MLIFQLNPERTFNIHSTSFDLIIILNQKLKIFIYSIIKFIVSLQISTISFFLLSYSLSQSTIFVFAKFILSSISFFLILKYDLQAKSRCLPFCSYILDKNHGNDLNLYKCIASAIPKVPYLINTENLNNCHYSLVISVLIILNFIIILPLH